MRAWPLRPVLAALLLLAGGTAALAQPSSAFIAVPSQPSSSTVPSWLEGWTGFGFQNNFYGGWLGANIALNPTHDTNTDGFLLRLEGVMGHYNYPTTVLPSGMSEVGLSGGSAMLGYRKIVGSATLSGYVGANVEDDANPDPTANIRGTATGVKFLGEVYSRLSTNQDFYGQAFFTTAFDSWFVLARPGFAITPNIWIGPEGMLMGDGQGPFVGAGGCTNPGGGLGSCRYDEGRVGGFIHLIYPSQPLFGDWTISGGYRVPMLTNGGPDGYYGQIGLSFRFQ